MSFNHDSQDGFLILHDSRTTKMVDHGVTKISLLPTRVTVEPVEPVEKKNCRDLRVV